MPYVPRISLKDLSRILLVLLLVGAVAPMAVVAHPVPRVAETAETTQRTAIAEVTTVHGSLPSATPATVYHWTSDRTQLRVTVNHPGDETYLLCRAGAGEGSCLSLGSAAGQTTTLYSWDRSDASTVKPTFVVREADSGSVVTRKSVSVVFVSREADLDGDGLTNGQEVRKGTYLGTVDSDTDGLADPEEFRLGTDPLAADSDGDGVIDRRELDAGTDTGAADSDSDGVIDGRELIAGTDPMAADSDGDGIGDGAEIDAGMNPLAVDTDGDRLTDRQEQRLGTNATSGLSVAVLGGIVLVSISVGALLGLVVAAGLSGGRRRWRALLVTVRSAFFYEDQPGTFGADAGANAEQTGGSASNTSTKASSAIADEAAADGEAVDQLPADEGAATNPSADTLVTDGASTPRAIFEQAQQELVHDEVVITQMLEIESGHMRQSDIVEATDWSKAKVSRLLSRMADDDEIVKVRFGRENVIYLPAYEPVRTSTEHQRVEIPGRNSPI